MIDTSYRMPHIKLTPAYDLDTTTTILLSQPNTILVDALPELFEGHLLLRPTAPTLLTAVNTMAPPGDTQPIAISWQPHSPFAPLLCLMYTMPVSKKWIATSCET